MEKKQKKQNKNNKEITITQIKSTIGKNKIQKKHLFSLGLKKIGTSKTLVLNKSIEGLLKKVGHLIRID
tara:strand:+ start:15233 stop:15439 length:207 start_codon:yes stop_codon:yes gene_type:complete